MDTIVSNRQQEDKQPPAQTYGQRLRYERKLRGWTRDQLAEMLDVFKVYIGRWEREEMFPYSSDQQKLCELFGKTAQELGLTPAASSQVLRAPLPNRNATETFRCQLKHERESRGWSRIDLARELGASEANISRWEHGETFPAHGYWQKLTELFGKTVQEQGLVPDVPEQEIIAGSSHNYGKRLKYHRKLEAWSQKRLANEVGTTPRSVVRWEQGETLPELRFQQRLCELFGKDPEELGFMLEQAELTGTNPLPENRDRTSSVLLLRQRRVRGWTQRDVAERIGTYPMNISKWERGEAHPGPDFQQKLCELFQCKYDDLGLLQSPMCGPQGMIG